MDDDDDERQSERGVTWGPLRLVRELAGSHHSFQPVRMPRLARQYQRQRLIGFSPFGSRLATMPEESEKARF